MCIGIEGNLVADPTEEALPRGRIVICLLVAIEALLAQRDPDTQPEGLFDSMNRDFEYRSDEAIGSIRMCDRAEVLAEDAHLRLLLVRQRCVLVRRDESEAR